MFLLLYGVAIFVTGTVTKFKPLIAGSIIFWTGAICCAFFKDISIQLLIYAIVTLWGYLIPGYILKSQYKKSHV